MCMQRDFLLFVAVAAAAIPAMAQTPSVAAPAGSDSAASIPNFSRVWTHPAFPWDEPPASGPGPITNLSRWADQRPGGMAGSAALPPSNVGISDYDQLVGDYKSPILQPWAAAVVKRLGEMSLAGITFPNPSNQCWPFPTPYIYKQFTIQMIQQPDRVTILYSGDHEVRRVRLNEPHRSPLTPSWYGDSVGHYEGDTLVIDTVGVKTDRPYAMLDLFGTPYTEKLHVVERYRLLDSDAAKGTLERAAKELWRPAGPFAPNYADKYLQVDFTIDDEGAFTTPWTASVIYARDRLEWPEVSCAENPAGFHSDRDIGVPHAVKTDF